jgi:acetyltransferase-like isoleucine patch superfamily enzyme
MYKEIMDKYPYYKNTCPINDLKDKCITFIRSKKYLNLNANKDVVVLVPKDLDDLPDGWHYEFVDNVDYIFTMVHNTLYKDKPPLRNVIGRNCFIHPTAVLDVEGMHVTKAPNGSRIQLKHMGNIVIEDDVMILALATLQRAVFGSTTIERGVKIDSHVNIGHNSFIGQDSVVALGAILGGSVKLGKNCMVGLGAVIRNGVTICDNVIIGMGSIVVSDITESGIYMGSPAKFFKPYSKEWNF